MRGLEKIVGQPAIVARLVAPRDFFVSKGATPGHILLTGPEGMGKHTIALAFAEELGVKVRVAFSRSIEHRGELSAILTNLDAREFLLIEDVSRLRQPLQEILALSRLSIFASIL